MTDTRRLRILQIAHDYRGPFAHVCAQYNVACAGHDTTTVYIAGAADEAIRLATGGDDVRFLGFAPKDLSGIKWALLRSVWRVFRERRYDIVIAHRYKSINVAGVMSVFFSIPCLLGVLHEHGVLKRPTRSLFFSIWRRRLHAVAVSDSVAQSALADCSALGTQRLSTLHHSIDPSAAGSWLDRATARAQLGVEDDDFLFGSVGRLIPKKRFDLLLRALAGLVGVRLVLIGDGRERSVLQALAIELGVAERVQFVGHVDTATRLLRAFAAFVLPSGAEEAFGIVMIEAMLAKVPVLASDAPGPSEVLGYTGKQFRDGVPDARAGMMQDLVAFTPEARSQLAAAGLERVVTKFSPERFHSRFWSLPPVAEVANV